MIREHLQATIENTLVPHTAFVLGAQRLEQCFVNAARASEPVCIAVVGESRTGKSRVLEECAVRHPSRRDREGLEVPVLRVKTPSKPTVKGLVELMLQAIGDPSFATGTENAKTIRLRRLMAEARTRMVMIDEFQHFYDKGSGSSKVMHVADWLKILVDDCKVALVVAGLPSCRAVIDRNEQLAGRFLAPILMPRFDWTVEDEREEFIGILAAFAQSLGEHFELPPFDTADLAFRFYCGTGGLIGYLTKLLRQAVWDALDAGSSAILLEDLARAHRQVVWSPATGAALSRPFEGSVDLVPCEDVLKRVLQIGTATEPTESVVRRSRPSRLEKMGAVLAAT